jgi:hypothetical protein
LLADSTPSKVLDMLQTAHPRLMWDQKRIDQVKEIVASDPLAKRWEAILVTKANAMLTQPPVEHVLIGPRLLDKSRTALDRITTLAGLYRLTGDKRYANRAKKEMLAVSAFADWNPSHFLDVAEMTNAVGLGYDWLYADLSTEERATIRQAIVSKGLEPGLAVYAKATGWHTATYNWNQVCNGGLTVGALAIADEEPETCEKVIEAARKSIPIAMASFAPDGGWAEGPGYWAYATQYNVFYLAAIETALGTDFGLEKMPGFSDAGNFRIELEGPSGQVFNFADGGPKIGPAAQMLWFARTFNRPDYDAFERIMATDKPGIFHLIWFNPQYGTPDADDRLEKLPASQWFKAVQVAFLRAGKSADGSERHGTGITFVGFKGGDNKANHSHLDLGTFVMDALGRRWAMNMGSDDYNLPGYFGKQRWTYYRLRTEGQNTITLDGDNQVLSAKSPIIAFDDSEDHPFAVADLSDGYLPKAKQVQRGIAIVEPGVVKVQDEIDLAQPAEIVWHFHTDATVEASESTAVLTQPDVSGKGTVTLNAKIVSPPGAKFEVVSASPAPPQHPAPHTKDMMIRIAGQPGETRIIVLFSTADAKSIDANVQPLSKW